MKSLTCAVLAAALTFGAVAHADEYPSKPITLIVPFAPGTGMDAMSRVIAQELGKRLKQTIVIDNRAGANGTLGAAALMRAAPNGYTLGMGTAGTHAASPNLMKSVPYDSTKDFVPIGRVGGFVFMLAVNSSVPANSMQDLIAYAKAHPGKLSYAVANTTGLAVNVLLKSSFGFDATTVPYRGVPQAMTDLIAGRVSILVADRGPILPHLQSKAVRALMLTSNERSRLMPDVPSSREAGTDINLVSWVAMFAPAGTPPEITNRLGAELRAVVEDPNVSKQVAVGGFETKSGGPEIVTEILNADFASWRTIVREGAVELQ